MAETKGTAQQLGDCYWVREPHVKGTHDGQPCVRWLPVGEAGKPAPTQLGTCDKQTVIHEGLHRQLTGRLDACENWNRAAVERGERAPAMPPNWTLDAANEIYDKFDYRAHSGDEFFKIANIIARHAAAPAQPAASESPCIHGVSLHAHCDECCFAAGKTNQREIPAQPTAPQTKEVMPSARQWAIPQSDVTGADRSDHESGPYALQSDLLRLVKIVQHILRGFQETAKTEAAELEKELEER